MVQRVELRQLRYFAMVASELNFTRAAARLHIAQPALSRQIKQLEDELGSRLLERDKRSVRLTAAGSSFLLEARALLDQAEQALANARAGANRKLNVGYVWGLFHSTAPPAMHRLRAKSPALSLNLLDVTASDQARELSAGRLDFGFIGTAWEADAAGLAKAKVGECEFHIAMPQDHKLARKRLLSLEALANEIFLLISEDQFPGASGVMHQACEASGFKPRVLQVADRGYTLLGLVAAGCGIAILPETLRALPHESLVFRRTVPIIRSDLYVAWRKGLDPVLVDEMLAAIHA
jgi:DNA-binding transcriptional LysR family regulator